MFSKCCRCQNEINGADDFGRSARKMDGTFDDICESCNKELRIIDARFQQDLREFWNFKVKAT
jgi:hypothetical protein